MDTKEQEDIDNVAFNTFIGVLVSICGNALISVALNLQKRAHNKIQEKQMAHYFSNMDESPQWIPSSGFFPDEKNLLSTQDALVVYVQVLRERLTMELIRPFPDEA
ncbi:hypothetical protein RMATCC62417_11849 [Rhizopus microsporus]|nr:hypothetical protein RMATCC62417_11849 [Rhizopus microsporus]